MPTLSCYPVPLLSLAIWCPVFFGLLVLVAGKDERAVLVRYLSLFGAAASFAVTLPLVFFFDRSAHGMQFVERHAWIRLFHVEYALGVDGISMWLVVLTALMTLVVVIAGWSNVEKQIAQYMGAFLVLSGLMIGAFATFDGLLFYVFFEATLIPMFVGYFFAVKVLHLNLFNTLGSICGGMTSTPALGTLIRVAETDDVASAYAATYPIALVSVVLASQFIGIFL